MHHALHLGNAKAVWYLMTYLLGLSGTLVDREDIEWHR